ncbi:hypothetical protein [Cellulophaga sp. Hel_I_12]|uniref:hypothetical protein n=1 Tax=Cellulophaga sp. Hel_I_12 TaxID=1249972 RepID=UPI000647AEA9|nr:hypothetical protein [Cellulophaga sp. Hel_I_12]
METNFKLLVLSVFLLACTSLNAQELGEFKPKSEGYKSNKVGDGSKKIFISSFTINFEIYKEAVDERKATGFGRTITNAAKAKAAVGLATLNGDAIQETADKLYAEFLTDFKNNGFEIITIDEAEKTEVFKGWEKATGPKLFETDMTGIIAVVPTNYSYFYKERNAFSSKMAGFDKTPQNLSKELGDALIADVSLVFVFSELGTDWNIGDQAKVKLFVNYRLADAYAVSDEKTGKGITAMFDKSRQSVGLSSHVNFTRGKLSIGGSPEAQYLGAMKSDLEIDGALEKEKVLAYSSRTRATATLMNPVVSIRGNNYSETTKWLEPDGLKYAEGMYLAGKKMLSHHVSEILNK